MSSEMGTSGESQDQDATNLRLVIIHRLPRFQIPWLPFLRTRFRTLDPNDDSGPSFTTLARSARVMLCVGPTPVNSEAFDRYPSLECIVGSSAGLDHIDFAECRKRGIRVSSAGDSFSDDVADYAVGLLIDVLRRVSAANRFVRAGLWPTRKEFPLGSKVGEKRVGIVGLGSIGTRISKRLEAFGCNIAYASSKLKPNVPFPFYSSVHDLAVNSDVLIVCCSLTKDTHHIVNRDVLKALGKTGIIINVGRGALLDEQELVRFLVQGGVAGAGLDVYENEPHIPEELFDLDNVVLSPHEAFGTPESFTALQELIMSNLEAFFSDKPLEAEIVLEPDD